MATQYTAGITQGQTWTADIANQIGAAWETWTPTVTQNGTVAHTVDYAKYGRINKFVFAECRLDMTGTGTAGNQITVTPPVNIAGSGQMIGGGFFYDASANNVYNLTVLRTGATSMIFYYNLTGASAIFGVTPSIGLAASDQIRMSVFYEAA